MKYLVPLLLLSLLLSCTSGEIEIHEWRGVNRTGIYPDGDLLKEWPENGPGEIWTVDSLGRGYGSPIFVDDQFFITGEIDSLVVLHGFNLKGEQLWTTTLGKEWISSFPGSRSAPTVVNGMIYVGSGMGDLYCVNSKDGTIVWSRQFSSDLQEMFPLHGHSEAAVVSGDKVFWTPGGKTHNVVALNRHTGELVWSQSAFGERSAYNQGNLIRLPNREIFVTFTAFHLMGLDAETGELLWSQEQWGVPLEERDIGKGDTHPNGVLYENGSIFYSSYDGNRGVRLDLSEDGTEISEIWRNPEFDGLMGGMVKMGNYIYGEATTTQYFISVNATTGQISDSLKTGRGIVIAADEMLYYYNQRGVLRLISPRDGKLTEISSFKITRGTGQHFSHPVIYRGVLYLRHGQVLMAFDIRG
ncbi:MAG: PQQ-binding-like beta-propeller repeat protein [Bacteroidota bacterium]